VTAQNTLVRPYGTAATAEAAGWIARGFPVAVPTETGYGLAPDATSGEAVARIYEPQCRPSFKPLTVHVPDLETAERIAVFDHLARSLAERFWPGPLTLVLPLRDDAGIASIVTAGLPTIAIRAPGHPAMRDLLAATGKPLAAPSANASGRISPTRAEHVLASLNGRIPMVLDGGATTVGLESSIVAVSDGKARLLRPGPLTADDLGVPLGAASSKIEAPGQMSSHYAPQKPLRLNATQAAPDEWLIGFGTLAGQANLSPEGDLVEAAATLFDALHDAEAQPLPKIAVVPIPHEGLGQAINDRLSRAAAPR